MTKKPLTRAPGRRRRPRPVRAGWTTYSALMFCAKRKDGRTLAIQIGPVPNELDVWQPVLVDAADVSTVDAVFDEHSHKSRGPIRGLAKAMAWCEAAAKRWQRASGKAPEPCACDEIPMGKAAAE